MAIFRNITSKKKKNAFENPTIYCTSKFPWKKKTAINSYSSSLYSYREVKVYTLFSWCFLLALPYSGDWRVFDLIQCISG